MRRTRSALLAGLAATLAAAALFPAAAAAISPRGGMFTNLRGFKEVGAGGGLNAGDPDGYGAFSAITVGTNRLCYGYSVNGIATPTAAHIHRGGPTVNGPVVVTLAAAPTGSPGRVSGCPTVPPALLTQIRTTPTAFYVNVHNAAYPNGAIRGQLFGLG
jgi:hypothetical protein